MSAIHSKGGAGEWWRGEQEYGEAAKDVQEGRGTQYGERLETHAKESGHCEQTRRMSNQDGIAS